MLPDRITYGDKYGPAMEISDQAAADEYFDALVDHAMRCGAVSRYAAETLERANLGYYAGYYSAETRERVERLFHCAHPIFGPVAGGLPEPAEIFDMGMRAAARGHNCANP